MRRRTRAAAGEVADWLSSINLSQSETRQYELQTLPRLTGASTKVIITEYDLPNDLIQPHDVIIDGEGDLWYSDFGQMFLGKMDTTTGEVTQYPIPVAKPGWPTGTLDLEADRDGNIWIGVMYQANIARFDPKTERLIEIPMPTRVTFTREIEFDEEGNIWTCSSNGPTRHNERGRGSLIRIELPKGEPAADEGVKLERIILSHHQVAHVRQVPWHNSPHGDLLKKIDAMPAPKGIPVNKTLDKHFKKRMASFTEKQRGRFNTLRQGMDRVDPNMENRGLSYLKILEYIHHNEK